MANFSDRTVSVIDESGDAHTGMTPATIPDTDLPVSATVDPVTHTVYVTNARSATVSIITPPADLALTIAAPACVAAGSPFTETAVVTNDGPSPAGDTVTNLLIPHGVIVTSAPGATVESGTLVWADGTLAAGTSITHHVNFAAIVGVDATIAVGGVIQSTRYDPVPADNAAVADIHLGP